jgi:hypothetical protein
MDLVDDPLDGDISALLVDVPSPLFYGAGTTARDLVTIFTALKFPRPDGFVTALASTAARCGSNSPLYFVLAVPATRGASSEARHLVAGRLPPDAAETLRQEIRKDGLMTVPSVDAFGDAPIEWCGVSEERDAVTQRRDSRRPIKAFEGKKVVLWGCGGLGSWIGEFLARSGAASITLSDPNEVLGGLLVRQNFTELDIGVGKARALAARLGAIRDDLEVQVANDVFSQATRDGALPSCDVLIDATVNQQVAALMAAYWAGSVRTLTVARVATDRASSTLGLLAVSHPPSEPTLDDVESAARRHVQSEHSLESYRCFWDPPAPSDEVVAEPGCSVPTFHGSAADLAAIAGVLVSLLGPHIDAPGSGSHLVALPHSPAGSKSQLWIAAA